MTSSLATSSPLIHPLLLLILESLCHLHVALSVLDVGPFLDALRLNPPKILPYLAISARNLFLAYVTSM